LAASTGNSPQNTTGIAGRKPGSIFATRLSVVRDGVADAGVGHLLDRGREEADLARAEFRPVRQLGREHADAVDLVAAPVPIMRMRWPFLSTPSTMRTSTTTPR
jgi:hypothetical protein